MDPTSERKMLQTMQSIDASMKELNKTMDGLSRTMNRIDSHFMSERHRAMLEAAKHNKARQKESLDHAKSMLKGKLEEKT